MFLSFALLSAIAVSTPDTLPALPAVGPVAMPVGVGAPIVDNDTTPSRRRKAVEISDAYATRLKIHYIASFAMIPLFAGQAILGSQLFEAEQHGNPPRRSLREAHDAVAIALGALFVTNGVTGSMNWWETRHNPKGRTWRTIHASLMLLSEAGFAYTASLGERGAFQHANGNPARDLHRQWAEISAGTALVSYIMMWKPIRGDH